MARRSAKTCADCPRFDTAGGYCRVYAKLMVPRHPACRFGLAEIRREYYRRYQRVLRLKKRT